MPMDQAKSEMSWVEDVSYTTLYNDTFLQTGKTKSKNNIICKLPNIEKRLKNCKFHAWCRSEVRRPASQRRAPNCSEDFTCAMGSSHSGHPCDSSESYMSETWMEICCLESPRSEIAIHLQLKTVEKVFEEPPSLFYTLCMETWEDSVSRRVRSLHLLELEPNFSTHFCNH